MGALGFTAKGQSGWTDGRTDGMDGGVQTVWQTCWSTARPFGNAATLRETEERRRWSWRGRAESRKDKPCLQWRDLAGLPLLCLSGSGAAAPEEIKKHPAVVMVVVVFVVAPDGYELCINSEKTEEREKKNFGMVRILAIAKDFFFMIDGHCRRISRRQSHWQQSVNFSEILRATKKKKLPFFFLNCF